MNSKGKLEQIRHAAHEAMTATPAPSISWKRSLAWVMAFNGALTLLMAVMMSRLSLPLASLWGLTGIFLAAFLLAGLFAAIAPLLRPSGAWLAICVLVVAVLSLAVTPVMSDGQPLLAAGLPCLVTEFALSVVPVTLCIGLLRRFAYHPVRTWLGVLASGLVGLFTLHWHCQVLTGEHVLWFHLVPWLTVGALGVWIRSKLRSKTFVP